MSPTTQSKFYLCGEDFRLINAARAIVRKAKRLKNLSDADKAVLAVLLRILGELPRAYTLQDGTTGLELHVRHSQMHNGMPLNTDYSILVSEGVVQIRVVAYHHISSDQARRMTILDWIAMEEMEADYSSYPRDRSLPISDITELAQFISFTDASISVHVVHE